MTTFEQAWRDAPNQHYGRRERWGPYHRQAVRWIGRTLELFGARLEEWSWGWRP